MRKNLIRAVRNSGAVQDSAFTFSPPDPPSKKFVFAQPTVVAQILVDVDELGIVRYQGEVIGRRQLSGAR